MKKLLVLLTTLLLAACGKGSDEPTAIESTIVSITKEEYKIYEDEGIYLIKIYDKDADEGSKNALLKDTGEMLAGLSKLDEVNTVEIKWYARPFTDQSGSKPFEQILAIRFEADTFAEVDWENYKTLDLETIASRYEQNETLKD
ncbi:hypothetical protein [Psychrobacillus sp. NPDC093200]|uniref:hypothetical protein n=1 Tax=Psychrobacillus sp. NPDC093200 TaxID=3390656 RepID=UPI003D07AF98